MNAIRLSGVINENHELIVTLPDDVPVGPVELVLQPITAPNQTEEPTTERERIRAQLMAAGVLVKPEDMHIPADLEYVSDEELLEIGVLPEGAPRTDQLIDEDRGPH
jgi:hypothetical protein